MPKLTLSIDSTVTEAAKKYARQANTSVSKLVENYLIRLLTQQEESYPDEVQELIGYARKDDMPANVKEAKLEYLKAKYIDQ